MIKKTEYYRKQLEIGLEYQDYVIDQCYKKISLPLMQFNSKRYQYQRGETLNGAEIKYDMQFARTGNLWIESGEKAYPRNGEYVDSGILRDCWMYIIGDYRTIYLFATKQLRDIYASYPERENKARTSRGILLPEKDANALAMRILRPHVIEDLNLEIKEIKKLERIAQMLYNRMKRDPDQRLFWQDM